MNENYVNPGRNDPGNPGQIRGRRLNPLMSKYDLDPGDWRPLWYGCEVSVPIEDGGINSNSITINSMPYILTGIAHKIIGNTTDPSTSGLYQDGMYDVKLSDQNSPYTTSWMQADLLFGAYGAGVGGNSGGYVENLPYPIAFEGNRTVTFDVRNRIARTLVPESAHFTVAFVLHGIGSWGNARDLRG